MSHIHTNPGEHDTTASAYIVRLDTPEPSLMLHKHKLLGAWLQFGGHVELYENPWQALVREVEEESGYSIEQLRVLQPKHSIRLLSGVSLHPIAIAPLTHKFPGIDHYHSDWGFGFTTDQAPQGLPNDNESDSIECFTLEQLQELSAQEIPNNVAEIGKFVLTEGLRYWEQIPATEWSLEAPPNSFEQS